MLADKNLMSGWEAPTLKRVGGGSVEKMYQQMVYYNRMHVKTTLSQSILSMIVVWVDCEPFLLSAGLDFRACERKGGLQTAHQEMKSALPTKRKIPIGRNRYACQSNLICSNYAINNFQTECWFYTGCVKIKVIELLNYCVMNEIFSSSERSGF
jgi:hypothetical protein